LPNTATVTAPNQAGGETSDKSCATITVTKASAVGSCEFAKISFWQTKNGQAVIDSFNGGSTTTALGNWLASNFANLFGRLAGQTNAQVAAAYLTAFGNSGGVQGNTYAQAFSVALGVYADTSSLSGTGTLAAKYGFKVTPGGFGAATFNVGSNGAAFGVANNTSLSVTKILQTVDANFGSTTGLFYGGDQTRTTDADNVLSGINTTGGVH
jgi:hypothetical protein